MHPAILAVALVVSCGEDHDQPADVQAASADLEPGVVATVGRWKIRAASVGAIAAAQGIDRQQAVERAIDDALLASAAEESGVPDEPAVRVAVRGILGRAVLQQIAVSVRDAPVSEQELAQVTEARWLTVDRPESFRAVHAAARVAADAAPPAEERARALAERWLGALGDLSAKVAETAPPTASLPSDRWFRAADIRDGAIDEFISALRGIDAGDVPTVLQPVPAVSCDGRIVDLDAGADQRVELEFARAACALVRRGDVSPIVRTSYGFHVIMLLEVLPALRLDRAKRLELLHDDILAARGRDHHRALLERLRASSAVEIPANVDALVRLVGTEP